MILYRLYCFDRHEHIVSRDDFEADDDSAAIDHARSAHSETDVEIWDLGRRVAFVLQSGQVRAPAPVMQIVPSNHSTSA